MRSNINLSFFFKTILLYIDLTVLFLFSFSQTVEVEKLVKMGEIKSEISQEKKFSFWHIDDLCGDDDGNLYIADSGWNKIFKFNPQGQFVLSFGQEGQGPGEFLAYPKLNSLKINFGNDSRLYVFDSGNSRISVFDKKGAFIKTLKLPLYFYDSPSVNSKGNLILINPFQQDQRALACFDSNLNLIKTFLNKNEIIQYPYRRPKSDHQFLNYDNFIKLLDKSDNLIIISNFSLKIMILNKDLKLINMFKIENPRFLDDFKFRLKKALDAGGFLYPFTACLDEKGNIMLIYSNEKNNCDEIYVYNQKGNLLRIFLFPEKRTDRICWVNKDGYIYTVINSEKIGVFKKRG